MNQGEIEQECVSFWYMQFSCSIYCANEFQDDFERLAIPVCKRCALQSCILPAANIKESFGGKEVANL